MNPFTIMHVGSIYSKRIGVATNFLLGLQEFLEEIEPLLASMIHVYFIGDTNKAIKNLVEQNILLKYHVHFKPRVSHEKAISSMWQASALLLLIAPEMRRWGQTGKLFEYLAVSKERGTPILALAPKESLASEIIAKTRTGFTVDADDKEGIKKMLIGWLKNDG